MHNKSINSESSEVVRKKRVLLIIRWPVGGIRTFMRYVYRRFDASHYSFTILATETCEMQVLLQDLRELEVRYVKVPHNPSFLQFFKEVASLILSERFDIVHSHGFTSGISAALPALLRNISHILTAHDVLSEKQFTGVNGIIKKIALGVTLSSASYIHCVSDDAKNNLLEFFPFLASSNNCIVIKLGIESERFSTAEPKDIRREIGVPQTTYLIGFFGRFMSQKGFTYLVDAIGQLAGRSNGRDLVVACFGEGGFIREEREKIERKGLQRHFVFLPFSDNIGSAIKGVDVVVMPSLWESCGLLAMETLVCGIPLIASNCIGLREVVKETPSVVIEPRNSDALANAIQDLVNHDVKSFFIEYSKEARMKYDASGTSEGIAHLYHCALKGL